MNMRVEEQHAFVRGAAFAAVVLGLVASIALLFVARGTTLMIGYSLWYKKRFPASKS